MHEHQKASDAHWSIYLEQLRRYEAFAEDEDCLLLDTTTPTTT